jgi:hypothetical protein
VTAREDNPAPDSADTPSERAQELRALAYELLRKIEHQLGDLGEAADTDISATVAECERALAEIRMQLKSV